MSNSVRELISDFLKRRWESNPLERTIEIVRESPDQIPELLRSVIREIPKGGTFFDASISYLPLREFPNLVEEAIEALATSENEAAESLIAYASLQCLPSVHGRLERLFSLCSNSGACFEDWIHREANATQTEFLRQLVHEESTEREKAWYCLLESREPSNLQFARSTSSSIGLPHPFQLYANEVGYTSGLLPLYSNRCSHLVFPSDYFCDESAPIWRQKHHPTWRLDSNTKTSARFGGRSDEKCGVCGNALHHLMTLDTATFASTISSDTVRFATCLSCLGWVEYELFYRHDNQGLPQSVGYDGATQVPEFPSHGLKEVVVNIVPTPQRWIWQDWALSNSRENLHRILGHPSWIQGAAYPNCPCCNETMRFILQLDSDLPTADESEWLWGSGGIGYGFWCDKCSVSGFLWQCT